jgi:hypothetical protein
MTALVRALGAAFAILLPFNASAANCPPLEKVDGWISTVEDVQKAVATTYKGSWDAYIARWQQQRETIAKQVAAGGSVEIKSRNLVIAGDDLKVYLVKVEDRIIALGCLKRAAASGADIATFDTAAGGDKKEGEPPPLLTRQEARRIEGQDLALEIAPVCLKGIPAFQVTNLGERWPLTAEVSLYRIDTNARLSQRRVRLSNGQQLMFRVPEEASQSVEEVGIFIAPGWYSREFTLDARARC